MDPEAPPVVAVVVTADPGAWLEDALRGLADQDYPNLSVLIIDAGSTVDPTPRVAEVLPGAYVRRLDRPCGYAAAANEAITAVEGAAFFLMCHDDVCLDPDALRLLVEEAFRSNAGVVGPKLVAWEDPTRILQVGMSADKGGIPVPLAHPGELDQEQHDSVRDVFVAPGGATLIRVDLFNALGGFDPEMVLFGEDLDFCWRAQVAGARVLVAPAARARHLAASSSGMRPLQELPGVPPGPARQLVLRRRHELRAALKCYGRWHLLRVLPQLIAHSVAEVVVGIFTGHRDAARASASAWTWNLRRGKELRGRRRETATRRTLPDHEVRLLQAAGSARLAGLAEGLFARASAHVPHRGQEALSGAAVGEDRPWWPAAVWAGVALFLLIGSRTLINSGPVQVATTLRFGSLGHLFGAFTSSVTPLGLGQVSPAPLALAISGVISAVLGASPGLARTVMVVGTLPLGALGAYRLALPLASRRARLVAPVIYLALPLPYAAFTWGRWGDLVAFAAAPWLLGLLARAGRLAPYDSAPGPAWRRYLALGVVMALAGAFSPAIVPVVLLVGAGLVIGSLLSGQAGASLRSLGAAGAGAVVAWLLAFPWSVALVSPGAALEAVLGLGPATSRTAGVGALLGFEPAPGGTHWVGWALLAGMVVPLFFGREWRFGWGARLWSVGLVCWAVAWVSGRGWLGHWTFSPGVLLALAGAALTLSACMGVVAFERDLVGYGFGWRQVISVLGVIGVGLGILGALGHAGSGRWGAPSSDFDPVLSSLPGHTAASGFDELWVGDPRGVPGASYELAPGVGYAITSGGGLPTLASDWPPPDPGPARAVASALRLAESGRTGLVGRPLALLGIRYLFVPTTDAPGGPSLGPPPLLVQSLGEQLDLRPVAVDPSVLVFQNADWHSPDRPPAPAPAGAQRAAQLGLETLLWALAVLSLLLTRRVWRRSAPVPPEPVDAAGAEL
ncbi:MAG TPA: glycosyltransferase [Acidimicrobiales bacterium]|nr:glycosyltransferase [Acidimicrobiales bacterium]